MKILLVAFWFGAYAWTSTTWAAEPWKRHTIDASDKSVGKLGADGVRLADANGDGLLDVVTGWENGDAIRVCFHPGLEKVKEPWPSVTVGRVAGAEDAVFADLDGNGILDVVTCTEGKTRTVFFHWAPDDRESYADATAWKTEVVPALAGKGMWMFCLPFDANGDGRMDLILGSKDKGATVGWLERPAENPRDVSAWRYHPLYSAGWIMSIRSVDLDRDGREDVVFSDRKGASTGVWWLRNVGIDAGREGSVFAEPKRLGFGGEEVMFLDIADVNGDGRLDIAAAIRPDKIGYLLQTEGSEETWTEQFQVGGIPGDRFGTAKAVKIGDLTGDGRLNVAVTCENAKGDLSGCYYVDLQYGTFNGSILRTQDIGGPEGVKFDRIELLDLDGDGVLDLMTCEERDNLGVYWYENPAR
ncbi:MAG: VCBS repeat-containing protein [Verrucomicrobiae bacterium]|nr:VCBS repeat-containing protein [Verrucomicrobiae bacterium]